MLTILIPAYNNAETIRTAVESLLAQSYGDLRILISDDCSTDGTGNECMKLAAEDSRIQYYRQPRNLRYGNFRFVLNSATTPYFMWAAGDDRWHFEFVERCMKELERHAGIVCAVARVRFESEGKPAKLSTGTFSLLGDVKDNLWRFLSRPGYNSRMYGVFRTAPAQESFPSRSFHAYDWAFSAATLRFGGHAEMPEVLMFREQTPPERYADMVREDCSAHFGRLFPVGAMTAWLLREARIPVDRRIAATLWSLNVERHLACHPISPGIRPIDSSRQLSAGATRVAA